MPRQARDKYKANSKTDRFMQEIEKREMQLKVEKDMEAKALRASSRSYDETAVWFWAGGLSDGSGALCATGH